MMCLTRALHGALSLTFGLLLLSSSPAAEREALFNGKDLVGWKHYLWDPVNRREDTSAKMSDVWHVQDGILYCKGRPTGYIRTEREFENYKLTVEWRWPEGTTRGNNGVLIHSTTPNALGQWPKSIEVQLAFGNAGDFWVIGTEIEIDNKDSRKQGRRHLNLTDDSEKPAGEWNQMEIIAKDNTVVVYVNGDLVNKATELSQSRGAISLQSEGAPVMFRRVDIEPLEN